MINYFKKFHLSIYKLIMLLFDSKQKWNALFLLITSISLALMEASGVGSIVPLVNLIQDPRQMEGTQMWHYLTLVYGLRSPESMIVWFGGTVLAIYFSKSIMAGLQLAFFQKFSQNFFKLLSAQLMASYMVQPYTFFLNTNSSILAKNVTVEAKIIAENFINPMLVLISELLVLILIIAVMFIYRPIPSLVGILSVGIILGGMHLFTSRQSRRLGEIREHTFAQMSKICQESLAGVKDIKVSGTEGYFVDLFESVASRHGNTVALNNTFQQLPRLIIETVAVTGFLGFVLYAVIFSHNSDDLTAVAAMYMAATFRLMPSLNRIVTSVMSLRYLESGFNAIVPSLISAIQSGSLQERQDIPLDFYQNIKICDGYYSYPGGDRTVLNSVNLKILKGQVVGFIGMSGAGKSTLINVLLGLLSLDKGQVCLDGLPILNSNIRGWQSIVAYVPQNVYIIDDTIKHNIALGIKEEHIDMDKIYIAIEIAGLMEFVEALPDKANTFIGERGARMSGGQVQRLGIARAIYRNTPIIVLDEATSALDMETEEKIINSVISHTKEKTVIMIAHRYTSLKFCDVIYELKNGQIANTYTYNELINKSNQIQIGGN